MRLRAFGAPVLSVAVVLALVAAALAGGASQVKQAGAAGDGLIAFTRPDGVYVMRSHESGVRLLRHTDRATWVSWSPDGRKLAFVSYANAGGLWVMNADGTHPFRLVKAGWMSRPTWSPDGHSIAFTRNDERGLWVVNVDGSSLRPLTTRWAGTPDWSPDGRQIAFVGTAHGYGIYVMNVDGSNLHKLTPLTPGWRPDQGAPDWSPDGSRIAFTHMVPYLAQNGVNVQPNDEIWVMNANGGSRMRLTHNHVIDHDPVWSPDGSKIAYVAAFAGVGSSEIYVINADGTGFTRLTHNHVAEGSPTWQPALPTS